ncbi:MAG TPA: M55 family metallopeptidase [Streptosporangiaceae bacterium]|nr:M55 family metallopeptidase [Streptosporangiaceae bacterium]
MPVTILISADMEGATGVATPEDVVPGSGSWAAARDCWTDDVNAVIAALLEHGADEVLVTDAHGSGSNLEPNRIDPRAGLIRGRPRRFGMVEGIDGGVHGVVFLGYHGTVGSGGVLSHAFMPAGIHTLRVNGQPAGEGTVNAHLAAFFGVPVLIVSGDEQACEEAVFYAPSAEHVVTKRALTRFTARLRPAAAVRHDLAAAAGRAVQRLGAAGGPGAAGLARATGELCAEIEFSSENCAVAASAIPGVRMTGSRSVSYSSADPPAWYRCLGAIWTLARSALGDSYV